MKTRNPIDLHDIVQTYERDETPTVDLDHCKTLLMRLKRLMPVDVQEHFHDWYQQSKCSYITSQQRVDDDLYISVNSYDLASARNFIVWFSFDNTDYTFEFHASSDNVTLVDLFNEIIHNTPEEADFIESPNKWDDFEEILDDYSDFFKACEDE